MGSNLSPAKAVITCSPCEANLVASAAKRDVLLVGVRYMDDVALFAAYSASDKTSEEMADAIISEAQEMYPPPLKLELEPEAREMAFLESVFEVVGGDVWVRLKNKNEDAAWTGCDFKRLVVHPDSCKRLTSQMVRGALMRAETNSNYHLGVFRAGVEKSLEMLWAGHPRAWMTKIVNSLCSERTRHADCWETVRLILGSQV